LQFALSRGDGAIGIYNDVPVIESTWDDPLPLGMYGYNQFGFDTGLYGNIRNLELYWDDTAQKQELLYRTLDQSDAIFISSNRQWGTTVRVAERYPLTKEYYRALLGCPAEKDILWCYSVAQLDMFTGELGFELTAVFQSDPSIGNFRINDQFAEEAFTVYDHPKVLIFQKTENYDPQTIRQILGKVDISKAVHKTPRQASKFSGNLMLDQKDLEVQTAGGTWSELFPSNSLLNQTPWLAAVVWYLSILLLGLMAYPIVRIIFHGLVDRGYPFSRLVGLLFTAYLTWLASSTGAHFNRLTIGIVLALLLLTSGLLAYKQRKELLVELKTKKRYFLSIEILMLLFFLTSLAIRLGNPDLWHPWKGGEKPMDLSYFTAVLKSTVFPPYDPWYSGGYINYYYFGFVLVGVPVKLLGIIPGIAYNLILPTLFALTGLGAFSVGWNLLAAKVQPQDSDHPNERTNISRPFWAGITAAFTVLIMGNLGTLRMFWQGLQRLVAPDGIIDGAKFVEHLNWFFQGFVKFLAGTKLPYGYGDWYWIPSRALPGDTITEFPFFTFTYADLHAHMIALPITILVIGWAISILLEKWNWKNGLPINQWLTFGLTIAFGGLAIGTLRVTNTWDLPTFLALASLVIVYTIFRYAKMPDKLLPNLPLVLRKAIYSAAVLLCLVVTALVLYLPFSKFYGQAYNAIDPWQGDHSPFWSYLVHWGFQLFLIVSWFIWETREWLAATPVSALKRFKGYFGYFQVLAILFGLVLVLLTVMGIKIGWLTGLLAVWAMVLMLRPNQPDLKRLVFFMIGTGLVLILFVELFVLRGDVGRLNTVFKFYYQAWTLLGISAAAGLIWLIPAVTTVWKERNSSIWQVILAFLFFSVSLYPLTAAADKIRDRMSKEAPQTLNGTDFMQTARYYDQNLDMDLSQDYKAIQWMQNNVVGSPVIVETNTVEYRWGNRFTIYTGLPGVLGWNWHQRQQRGFLDYNGISERLIEIPNFYTNPDVIQAVKFLEKYHVQFVIVGQMERAYYPGEGLYKFEKFNGIYWNEVFREKDTVIYEVIK
jgi:YYY domain-containing protein